jgi:hypothetical protein
MLARHRHALNDKAELDRQMVIICTCRHTELCTVTGTQVHKFADYTVQLEYCRRLCNDLDCKVILICHMVSTYSRHCRVRTNVVRNQWWQTARDLYDNEHNSVLLTGMLQHHDVHM